MVLPPNLVILVAFKSCSLIWDAAVYFHLPLLFNVGTGRVAEGRRGVTGRHVGTAREFDLLALG